MRATLFLCHFHLFTGLTQAPALLTQKSKKWGRGCNEATTKQTHTNTHSEFLSLLGIWARPAVLWLSPLGLLTCQSDGWSPQGTTNSWQTGAADVHLPNQNWCVSVCVCVCAWLHTWALISGYSFISQCVYTQHRQAQTNMSQRIYGGFLWETHTQAVNQYPVTKAQTLCCCTAKPDIMYNVGTVCVCVFGVGVQGGGGVVVLKQGPGLNQKQRHFPLEKQWGKAEFTWANWQREGGRRGRRDGWMSEGSWKGKK